MLYIKVAILHLMQKIILARICSIHFDNNSYTSEYKMLDYLGCYTKVLKYDAVPTLYLPNTPSIVLKGNIDEVMNQEHLVTTDLKNIIVYTIPPVQEEAGSTAFETSDVQNFTTAEVVSSSDSKIQLQELESTEVESINDKEKYNRVTNVEQLQQLEKDNLRLNKEIETLQSTVEKLRRKLNEKQEAYKRSGVELNKLVADCNFLHTCTMSVQEQKSILSKVFSESQIKILSGKKKIYWSNDDMAVGYTIRHMSNKRCYMYLSKNLKIPLPALSSIKRWATLKKPEIKNEVKKEETFEASD